MSFIKSRKHAVPPHALALLAAGLAAPVAVHAQAGPDTATPAAEADTHADTHAGSRSAVELEKVTVQGVQKPAYRAESANAKLTAPILDTPQTVQVISEQLIRDQQATTLTEALRNTAGVSTFMFGENGSTNTGDAVYLRGYDASGSIFYNGIRDIGAVSRDTFNVQQIEVVKGPASSDVGRSSPTGYINLVTKRPTSTDGFVGSLGLGTAQYRRATVDANASLSGLGAPGLATRLNAFVEYSNVDGRHEVDNHRWGFAPSLAIGLGTATRVYLDAMHVTQFNTPESGVTTVGLPGYTSPDPKRPFITGAPAVDSHNYYGTSQDFEDVKIDMLTAQIEHDLGEHLVLTNTGRYGRTTQDYLITSLVSSAANVLTPSPGNRDTWALVRPNPNNRDQINTIFADQLNLRGTFQTGLLGHSFSAGAELSHEQQQNWNYYGVNATVYNRPGITNSGTFDVANLYHPTVGGGSYRRLRTGAGGDGTLDTLATYAFDTLTVSRHLQLDLGLRYDHYSTDYNASTLVTTGTTAGTLTPTSLQLTGNLLSGKAGVVVKPLESGSVYFDFATGAQPPGGANFTLAAGGTGNSANRTDFAPQRNETLELGTKWDVLSHRLLLTGALFQTDVRNQVVQDPVSLNYYQTGKQRVKGVELGAFGQLTRAWSVSTNYVLQDTSIVSGTAVTADGTDVLAYTPRTAFTLFTNYDFGHGLSAGVGALHNGALHKGTDPAIGTPTAINGYTLYNALLKYRATRHVDLQLNVYNLFNKDTPASITKSGYRYQPVAARSARLNLTYSY